MELLPAFLVLAVGPMVDKGQIWGVIAIIAFSLFLPMVLTLVFVKEEPLKEKPTDSLREPTAREPVSCDARARLAPIYREMPPEDLAVRRARAVLRRPG